MEGLKTDG